LDGSDGTEEAGDVIPEAAMGRKTIRRPPDRHNDRPVAASVDLFPGDAVGTPADEIAAHDGQADEYLAAHGESLAQTLDLDTWKTGPDFGGFYDRLRKEIADAVRFESRYQSEYRRTVFPRLRTREDAPADAGVWRTTPARIEDVHRRVLFNGGVEACDGKIANLDTVPITVTQIGLCLVSYKGREGTWGHRMFRRDLRETAGDPIETALAILERRQQRDRDGDGGEPSDRLSSLARRGIRSYAERAALLDRSTAPWRMGRGSPCPYELLTGSGLSELLRRGLDLMRRLVDSRKFVFVQNDTADRWLVTLGHALRPLEYVIVDDIRQKLAGIADGGYRGEWGGETKEDVHDFVETYGPQVVLGLYRASRYAPAQIFYAHAEHAHAAALIALSDSVLQEHRGVPLLLDLADGLCNATFGPAAFTTASRLAFAEAGEPFRYLGEQ
jgi:hypothetical protein